MNLDRRTFVAAAAASPVVLGASRAFAHLGSGPVLKIAVIGCGGRGTGAMFNAINAGKSSGCTIEVVALADLFEERAVRATCPDGDTTSTGCLTAVADRRGIVVVHYEITLGRAAERN